MGSRISEKPERLFEVFLEIGKPEGVDTESFIIHQFPEEYDDKETLTMIPKFAYPCETDSSNVDHFTFVLTDIDSMFRFGYCRHTPRHQTCLCVLSSLPWCEVFFKMLDVLAEITNRSERNSVNDFLQAAYSHEIPLPKVPVTIVANEDMFNFTSPDPNILPSIPNSRNLTEYYNAVDPSNMMRIFASMLQERRIYMTSKKLSRLTACIHAAEALLYPMHWQHLFIPVLPAHLIDYISAPMPYLIGIHSNLVEKLRINRVDVADAVIVDLDANTVTSEYEDLESIPEDVASHLKKNLKADIVKNSMLKDGDAISKAFLHALVRLIGGYRAGLKIKSGEPITFDPELFVHSRSSQTMQNYLLGMLALQIFQQFIYGRLEILNRGGGFVDLFEQQATVYEDRLVSQSSYKEWLRNVKKGGRKGKEVWNGFKVKAAPGKRMSKAVKSVKVQGKKAVADLRTKISSITEDDRRSAFQPSGGIVHSRRDKQSSRVTTENRQNSRPPRPPLPSNRRESGGGLRSSAGDIHDDSQLRLSYHKVNLDLMGDADIQAVMMRSASAEALPKYGQEGSTSSFSSLSSESFDDKDGAIIPFGNLQSSDDEDATTFEVERVGAPTQSQQRSAEDQSSNSDRLIVSRVRPNTQPPARPMSGPQIISPPPVAPPRNKRGGNNRDASPGHSPVIARQRPQAPKPQPRTSLINLDNGGQRETAATSASSKDAPLIRLESSESDATDSDVFDPLSKSSKSSVKTAAPASSSKPDDLNFIVTDEDKDEEGREVQMRKLERNGGSRSSLTRSQAFRRESEKGRLRLVSPKGSYNPRDDDDNNNDEGVGDGDDDDDDDDEEDEDEDDKFMTPSADLSSIVFDPLSAKRSSISASAGSETLSEQRNRTSSDLMRHEWSLASLAPSPHVYLPMGVNQGVGMGPNSNSLTRQATLPANPFLAPVAAGTAGVPLTQQPGAARRPLLSQASIPAMGTMAPMAPYRQPQPLAPTSVGAPTPTPAPTSQITQGANSDAVSSVGSSTSSAQPGSAASIPTTTTAATTRTHRVLPTIPPQAYPHSTTSSSSRYSSLSMIKPEYGQQQQHHSSLFSSSSSSSSSSFSSSAQQGLKPTRPVQSPFFSAQGGNPIHSHRTTMGPSSFSGIAASKGSAMRSSYAPSASASLAKGSNSAGPPKRTGPAASDPFGDLVDLGFGSAEKKSAATSQPQQQQQQQPQPPQQQQEKKATMASQAPPRPPQPQWETFDS